MCKNILKQNSSQEVISATAISLQTPSATDPGSGYKTYLQKLLTMLTVCIFISDSANFPEAHLNTREISTFYRHTH